MEWAGFRDINYRDNFGVYEAGDALEVEAWFDVRRAEWRLFRLDWNPSSANPNFVEVAIEQQPVGDHRINIKLPDDAPSSAWLLVADQAAQRFAQVIIVNGADAKTNPEVVVVRPVFTEWGYHRHGFYWNEQRRLPDKLLGQVAEVVPGSGRVLFPLRKVWPTLLKYPYRNPAHPDISLDGYYETNPRWLPAGNWAACDFYFDHSPLNLGKYYGTWPGMWTEDIKSTLPTYALLQKAGIRFRTRTDVDVHLGSKEITSAKVLLFYAQELMTAEYLSNLEGIIDSPQRRVIFFGVQGIGYKEVRYDSQAGLLSFVGERTKKIGLSGEVTNGVQPSWGRRDSEIFGFEFPDPYPNWRRMARQLKVIYPDHWLVRGLPTEFTYEVRDPDGNLTAGLTRAGGEYFVKTRADAEVIATLDETEIVGFGVCGNLVILSPTYWPSFGFYQKDAHPEVLEVLRRAVQCNGQLKR